MVVVHALVLVALGGLVQQDGHGEAPVVRGDEDRAFNDANEAAFRAAVRAAATVKLEKATPVVEQFTWEFVFGRRQGYLKGSALINAHIEKNVALSDVRTQLDVEVLDRELVAAREVMKKAGRPALLVHVAEWGEGPQPKQRTRSGALAAQLAQRLGAEGWDVKVTKPDDRHLAALEEKPLPEKDAKALGDDEKVHFVLSGTVPLQFQQGLVGADGKPTTFPVVGLYDLRLVSVETGASLGRFEGRLTPGDLSEGVDPLAQAGVSYAKTTEAVMQRRAEQVLAPLRPAMLADALAHPPKPKGCTAAPAELGLAALTAALVRFVRR